MIHRQILGLDLLRFAAAAMVAVFHVGPSGGVQGFWFGWVGVPVFFILSGFVIANSAQNATPGSFLKNRIVRLMPAVWICATLTFALLAATDNAGIVVPYLKSLVLWPVGPWIQYVYWTLPVEAAFYVAVFLTLLTVGKARLSAVLMAMGAASSLYWASRAAGIETGLDGNIVRYLLLEHGCLFAAGGLLRACLMDRATPLRLGAIAIATLAGLTQTWFTWQAIEPRGPAAVPIGVVLAAVAVIVASVKLNRASRHADTIRLIGLTTYPLYLIHMTLGALIVDVAERFMPGPAAFVLSMLALVAFSALIAATAEPFVQAQLRRLLRASPAPRPR